MQGARMSPENDSAKAFEEWVFNEYGIKLNEQSSLKWDIRLEYARDAWQAATKAALGSRVVGPSDDDIEEAKRLFFQEYKKIKGQIPMCAEVEKWIVNYVRDSIKLVPLSVENLISEDEFLETEFPKKYWSGEERDIARIVYGRLRESIKKRLGGV